MTARPGAAEWVSFVLICASAALGSLLELMFLSQYYIGTVIVPVVILATVAQNLVLPRWGRSVLDANKGAVLPVALWLVVTLVPTLYTRPEGDLFVLGTDGQQYAYYAMLFAGAIVGFGTVVVLTNPKR